MLHCNVTMERNGFHLAARLRVDEGEIVAVVGPNGAGKSTLLRIIAGLEHPSTGRLSVGEEVWIDTAGGTPRPAEQRSVGYMPQEGLLFPHMTVRDNIAFGARHHPDRVEGWMVRLGIDTLADARPGELSGGQAQLVSFARAQAADPAVLLLDEPLVSVDVANRTAIRRILRRELRRATGYRLFVTHDPLEAAALADRIVVLDRGRVVQEGTIDALRSHPRSTYVAELVGVNLFRGVSADGNITLESDATLIAAAAPEGPVLATIHPRAVSLYRARPSGSPRNVWRAPVLAIEPSLDQVRVALAGPIPIVAEVTRAGASVFSEGDDVWVAVKASEVMVYSQ